MPEGRKGPSIGDPVIELGEAGTRLVTRRIAEVSPGQAWAVELEGESHAVVEWRDRLGFLIVREWCPR